MSDKLPLFERSANHKGSTAIIDSVGSFTYNQLMDASARVGSALLGGASDLAERRIAFLTPPGFSYAATQWGIWRAGGVAVPLALSYPPPELEYVIDDTQADIIVCHPDLADRVRAIAFERDVPFMSTEQALTTSLRQLPQINTDRRAMILYTSGTTSRPKGVVSTHANIQAQVETLIEAWQWTSEDHILLVLPLHHVHGIINVLTCALWAGAACEMMNGFDADKVWTRIAQGDMTLFMAVPTIYARLIQAWTESDEARQKALTEGCSSMRLMVSGSAALPVPTLESWRNVSGHILLERYGMTEIGMALSNPLHGQRVPGHVGTPLPHVDVRRVDESGSIVADDVPGEIEVRGPSIFLEYWGKPQATRDSFRDGWFKTGDIAVVENGVYRILGRNSVDIIKTGGYKVSALEIEEVLRTHPVIHECAVVGTPDEQWGECVSVCVVKDANAVLSLDELRDWTKQRLAAYKVPQRLLLADHLPRNAMGKIQKPQIAKMFENPAS